MQYCYELYKSDTVNIETKISTIELLRVVGDRHVLTWIPEFLDDANLSIQAWVIGIIDQLLFSRLIHPEDVKDLLLQATEHANPYVREKASDLLSCLEE